MLYRKLPYLILLAALAAVLTGCAGSTPPVDFSKYIWPNPPEETKIKLIKIISTDLDVRQRSFVEEMFGEDVTFNFGKPTGIAVDADETMYVTDDLRRAVVVINMKTGVIEALNNPYGWRLPIGVAVDNKNNLIAVSDAVAGKVYLFSRTTKTLKKIVGQKSEFVNPVGVAFDPDRKILYVSDSRRHAIDSFTLSGEFITTVAQTGVKVGEVYYPAQIATDSEGRLYVVDTMNFRIQIFDPTGEPTKAIGEHGDRPGMFARPKGVGVSSDGHIFATDAAFGNFQVFDRNGGVYLFVGQTGRGLAMFNVPQNIFVDESDKIYVVDQMNKRVQIFQYMSERHKKSLAVDAASSPAAPAAQPPAAK